MAVQYQHTHIGYVILFSILGGGMVAILPALFLIEGPSSSHLVWVSVAPLLAAAVLFGSLTVRVTDETLSWFFGPGLLRQTLPLASIDRVEAVQTSVMDGWGVRKIREGWLYTVSGFDAVEVETTDGDWVRIGTDEPERLADVLASAASTPQRQAADPPCLGGRVARSAKVCWREKNVE